MSAALRQISPGQLRRMVRAADRLRPDVQVTTRLLALLRLDRNIDVLDVEDSTDGSVVCTLRAWLTCQEHPAIAHATLRLTDYRNLLSHMPSPRSWDELTDREVLSEEGSWPHWPRLWLLRAEPDRTKQFQLGFLSVERKGKFVSSKTLFRVHRGMHEAGKLENYDYPDARSVLADRWHPPRTWSVDSYDAAARARG